MSRPIDQLGLADCLRLAVRLGGNGRLELLQRLLLDEQSEATRTIKEAAAQPDAERERPRREPQPLELGQAAPDTTSAAGNAAGKQTHDDAPLEAAAEYLPFQVAKDKDRLRGLARQLLKTNMVYRGDSLGAWTAHHKSGSRQRPVLIPLTAPADAAAFVAGLALHWQPTRRIDIPKLVLALALRRPPARAPRTMKRGIGSRLFIWQDTGVGMRTFSPDQQAFADTLQRLLGSERCIVSAFTPGRRIDLSETGQSECSLVARIEPNSTLLILSDLHRFGREYSYGHTETSEWLALEQRLRTTQAQALVLVPGAPNGAVPRPAHPQFFNGKAPRIGRLLPWDDSLTPPRARQYATGSRVVRFDDMTRTLDLPAPDTRTETRKLFALMMTLVSDIDLFTLRTLRLALSNPLQLRAQIEEWIPSVEGLDRPDAWDSPGNLEPLDAQAAALDEYAIWISDVIQRRGAEASLLRKPLPGNDLSAVLHAEGSDEQMQRTIDICREALMRQRAGRGFETQRGDAEKWTSLQWRRELRPRGPGNNALREKLEADHALLRDIEKLAQTLHPDRPRLQPLDRRAVGIARVRDEIHIAYESTLPKDSVAYQIRLAPGLALEDVAIAGWTSGDATTESPRAPRKVKAQRRHGAQILPAVDPVTRESVQVIELKAAGVHRIVNIDASRDRPQPLFRMMLPDDVGDLRFESGKLVAGDRLLDPIGLLDLGEAPARVSCEKPDLLIPEKADLRSTNGAVRGFTLVHPAGGAHIAIVQAEPTSAELVAFHLPGSNSSGHLFVEAQNGCMALAWGNRLWWGACNKDAVEVLLWEAPDLYQHRKLLAASRSGAVMAARRGEGTDIRFFSSAPHAPEKLISVHAETRAHRMAVSDTGLIALAGRNELWILQPLDTLGRYGGPTRDALNRAASAPNEIPPIEINAPRVYQRHRLQGRDLFKASVLEALVSTDTDALSPIFAALKEWGMRLELEDARTIEGLDQPETLVAVWNFDPTTLQREDIRANLKNFRLPGSGFGLLHIAANHRDPAPLLRQLVEAGCDVDMIDRFGQTALYVAAFAEDDLRAVETLLDLGANAALTGERGGHRIGPLPALTWRLDFRKPRHAAIFGRLLAAGADPLAFSNSDCNGLLSAAASSADPAVLEACLALDPRVDHVDTKGYTPLLVAIWYGRLANVRQLIEAGASIELSTQRGRALLLAIQHGEVEIVQALLDAGASPNRPNQAGETPLRVLKSARMRPSTDAGQIDFEAELVEIDAERRGAIAAALARAGAEIDVPSDSIPRFPLGGLLGPGVGHAATQQIIEGFAAAGKPPAVIAMALDHATRENSPDRLVRLLSYPIDANAVGQDGLRLVHILSAIPVLNSVDALLDKLVEHGADLAACDAAGSTALHYAAASGNETMVTKLLERHGALINNARIDDALAGDVAALFGHDRLAARLNRNPAFAAASPGAQGYQTPTQQEYSQLQFLPAGTAWTSLPLPPSRRGGVPSGLPAPLPLPQLLSRISFWRPTACRRAFLYADRWLEETWWRSENGHCGISARVTDSHGNKMVMEVTGTSSAIHEMNTTQPPRPKNEAEALRYLKFFCHSVHGELGPFSLCETEEIVQAHLPASVYHKAESLRYSINVEPGVDGHWQILIPVRYAHGLYQTKFSIAPGGTIEMLDDEPLLDWEGTRDDRPFGSDANIYFYTPKN